MKIIRRCHAKAGLDCILHLQGGPKIERTVELLILCYHYNTVSWYLIFYALPVHSYYYNGVTMIRKPFVTVLIRTTKINQVN